MTFSETLENIIRKLSEWGFSMGFGWEIEHIPNGIRVNYEKEEYLYDSLRRCWNASQAIFMASSDEPLIIPVSIKNTTDQSGKWSYNVIFDLLNHQILKLSKTEYTTLEKLLPNYSKTNKLTESPTLLKTTTNFFLKIPNVSKDTFIKYLALQTKPALLSKIKAKIEKST